MQGLRDAPPAHVCTIWLSLSGHRDVDLRKEGVERKTGCGVAGGGVWPGDGRGAFCHSRSDQIGLDQWARQGEGPGAV